MSDWRRAQGVLNGALWPGETPEQAIRRARGDDAEDLIARLEAERDRVMPDMESWHAEDRRRREQGEHPLGTIARLDARIGDYEGLLDRIVRDRTMPDRIAALEAERDRVFAGELIPGVLAARIIAQRDCLLRYVRADWALASEDKPWTDRVREWHAARQAVRDAGLLEGER